MLETPEASLELLFDVDAGDLSDLELVELMIAARRWASRVQAVELAAVAELARRRFAETTDGGAEAGTVVEVLSPADYVHEEVSRSSSGSFAPPGERPRGHR